MTDVDANGEVIALVAEDVRQRLYHAKRAVRHLQRKRVRACGWARTGDDVSIVIDQNGKGQFRGVQHCSCFWECCTCQMLIKGKRRQEVEAAVESWGQRRCVMMTLTLSHARKDKLGALRKGLARAYTALTRGAPWGRFKDHVRIAGSLRVIELKHGANGWHPHIHVVWFLQDEPKAEHQIKTSKGTEWIIPHAPFSPRAAERDPAMWIRQRWQTMVERHVGAEHIPHMERGVTVTTLASASYVTKLGLEVADPGDNKTSGKSRTPVQIAYDYARFGRKRDAALWRVYSRQMRGTRALTWSVGMKAKLGILSLSDAELLAEDEQADTSDRRLGVFGGALWHTIRIRRVKGIPAPYYILRQVSERGPSVLTEALATVANSSEVDSEITRGEPMGLLAWLPEWTGPPPNPGGNLRRRVCPGCGGVNEERRPGCYMHRLCEPFTIQWKIYEQQAEALSAMHGADRCRGCGQWTDQKPPTHCHDERHHGAHGTTLAEAQQKLKQAWDLACA